ncbi:MAG: hypothetical protein NTW86_19215 [Candidatus Sumerlaeota bacterium]|nr:hypothetical protein [Candidatus Sumerlaeota bacterium]
MKNGRCSWAATLACLGIVSFVRAEAAGAPAPKQLACNRVRFCPAPNGEQAMVGGKFTGSNVSPTEGFEVLAEIQTAPPAQSPTRPPRRPTDRRSGS